MRNTLLLIAAAMLAFGLAPGGSFHYDDFALFSDPRLTSWTATRPLTNLTFALNRWLGGEDPSGYLAFNLALHICAVLLLRSVLARVIGPVAAIGAALIFAVHPIAAEPVNYVFARGTLLATVLVLVALRSWLDGRLWAAVGWFAAALLAKEECAAFPIFLAALNLSLRRPRREFGVIAAMTALSIAAGVRVIWATSQFEGAGAGFGARIGPARYAAEQGVAILRYLLEIAVPWGYSVDPALPEPALWIRLLAWLAVAALAALAVRDFRNARSGFWCLGALILLLPSSSILPADDFAADRRMYLPMIALSAALGPGLARIDRRLAAAVVIALAAISIHYTLVWRTEAALWTEAARLAPQKARPRLHLARAASTPEQAVAILAEAQSIAPSNPDIASEQGRQLLALGRPAEALSAFGRALALTPRSAAAISNRAVALARLGQADAARQEFRRALSVQPCLFDAQLNLKRLGGTPPLANCRFTRDQMAELSR